MESKKNQSEKLEVMFMRLEGLIQELEGSDVTLEQSFSLYHKGMDTIKKCSEAIDYIEKKVQVIDQNGEYHDM